jgi:hypothetical protein
MSLNFKFRAPSDPQELPVFAGTEAAMSLRNITGNRNRGASDLTGEAEKFFLRKTFG